MGSSHKQRRESADIRPAPRTLPHRVGFDGMGGGGAGVALTPELIEVAVEDVNVDARRMLRQDLPVRFEYSTNEITVLARSRRLGRVAKRDCRRVLKHRPTQGVVVHLGGKTGSPRVAFMPKGSRS